MAEQLGLRPVGWIFTDLVAADLKQGTVKHFRGNIVSVFCSFHCDYCIILSLRDIRKYPIIVCLKLRSMLSSTIQPVTPSAVIK